MKIMVENQALTIEELSQYKIIEKTHLILKNMLNNEQSSCLESLLDIIHSFLAEFNDVIKQNEEEIKWAVDCLFNNFDFCVQLLNLNYEVNIVEKASQCLIQMLQLYA